ncbi:hypothetical protein L226DRAFT_426235, partial [Lentinus tigrinus ALCF2SS1-7]
MSIPTGNCCVCFRSRHPSGMSGIQPTPLTAKSYYHITARHQVLQPFTEEGWKRELEHRINPSSDQADDFLKKFVPADPSADNCPSSCELKTLFKEWEPIAGKEKDSYPFLLKDLNKLVSQFPREKRLRFIDTHGTKHQFPFSAFAENHNVSFPDLAVTFPGLSKRPKRTNWTHYSMILEAKATRGDDPYGKNGHCHCKTLVQLAINARCLMHAHGLLATFVIGIYGDIIRIARFDHGSAVVCRPLSVKDPRDLKLLQRFFWNFVNPAAPGPFVGWDPTVRRLNPKDDAWLRARLEKIGEEVDELKSILSEARRVELPDENLAGDGKTSAYFLIKVLDVNGRLFSRATTVWLGVRDTRYKSRCGLIVDSPEPDDMKLRVIKEAWRQVVRRSERDVYARLQVIPSDIRVGLPNLLCGGDLGEQEVQLWESSYGGNANTHAANDSELHRFRLSTSILDDRAQSGAPLASRSHATNTIPPHRPMQQTFSWRLARGTKYWYRERSHMRFVTDTVGRPLVQFRCTEELVTAVRDAILGHRLAVTLAGVLHRDISVGNILIVDKPSQGSYAGFLHDFDYSSMSEHVPDASFAHLEGEALAKGLIAAMDAGKLKERSGTYHFMAISQLIRSGSPHGIHHDLESTYWVLVWVVVRHVAHQHTLGAMLCSDIFPLGQYREGCGGKIRWLGGEGMARDFVIPGNAPLTDLLRKLAALVNKHSVNKEDLTYDMFLAPFQEALDRKDWPVGD